MSVPDQYDLTNEDVTRLIGMAWADDVPFEAIEAQYGVPEDDVIVLMRSRLKRSSWKLWRERVSGRPTKHAGRSGLSQSTSRRPPGARSINAKAPVPPDNPSLPDDPPSSNDSPRPNDSPLSDDDLPSDPGDMPEDMRR